MDTSMSLPNAHAAIIHGLMDCALTVIGPAMQPIAAMAPVMSFRGFPGDQRVWNCSLGIRHTSLTCLACYGWMRGDGAGGIPWPIFKSSFCRQAAVGHTAYTDKRLQASCRSNPTASK